MVVVDVIQPVLAEGAGDSQQGQAVGLRSVRLDWGHSQQPVVETTEREGLVTLGPREQSLPGFE